MWRAPPHHRNQAQIRCLQGLLFQEVPAQSNRSLEKAASRGEAQKQEQQGNQQDMGRHQQQWALIGHLVFGSCYLDLQLQVQQQQ
jgi:hypothetical protein